MPSVPPPHDPTAAAKKGVTPPPGYPGPGGVTPPPGYPGPGGVAPPPGYPGPQEDDQQPAAKRTKLDSGLSDVQEKKQRTVFLSNLDFEVDEGEIEQLMSSSGHVVEVRLVKHPNGKSKGFAFVEFETVESAAGALKRDNELIRGRPMYISECDPEKKKAFKYKLSLEKNKLFVKGT
jgi:hypothetical protein